ncbi:MAG: rhodanese-related sulfurtransferase [Candidatus Kaistia colombiensis]|nr:MAG: rhodanese-related sulfurtransferase [Kaistia sp.]
MTYKVAALYQFASLPDFEDLRAPLLELCDTHEIRGTLLLSPEGINGTIAGPEAGIDAIVVEFEKGALFGSRLDNLELKFSTAAAMPFKRLKVRLKKEIVTLAQPHVDPTQQVGTYVAAEDWNALISDPDVIVVDTRNRFEVKMGTFERALDPETRKFSQFPDFVGRTLDPDKNQKVAMFCTGGIRCEKASSYLLSQGFAEVFHLKGGILKYLETIPPEQSLWQGECFVFDERVALGHGLVERALADEEEGETPS